jgi:hypothetical protein
MNSRSARSYNDTCLMNGVWFIYSESVTHEERERESQGGASSSCSTQFVKSCNTRPAKLSSPVRSSLERTGQNLPSV